MLAFVCGFPFSARGFVFCFKKYCLHMLPVRSFLQISPGFLLLICCACLRVSPSRFDYFPSFSGRFFANILRLFAFSALPVRSFPRVLQGVFGFFSNYLCLFANFALLVRSSPRVVSGLKKMLAPVCGFRSPGSLPPRVLPRVFLQIICACLVPPSRFASPAGSFGGVFL